MADDTLLADLCGICYNHEPKYRCPGCNARTCSLPCYQKHRQRASCSGKRDPAAYLKKSQWATPAGIDRDYNYLRGIERALDHADHSFNHPSELAASSSTLKNVARGRHPHSVLQRYLANNRITVQHAPLGMTRQKSNQTRPTKRNNVVWTVEWIAPQEDYLHLEHDCLESTPVADLFASLRAERGIKRKRGNHQAQEDVKGLVETQPSPSQNDTSSSSIKTDNSTTLSTDTEPSTQTPQDHSVPNPQTTAIPRSPSQHSFYLLRPSTTSPAKILIPIDAHASLTDNLRDRIVQEYPTIYVFPSPSPARPSSTSAVDGAGGSPTSTIPFDASDLSADLHQQTSPASTNLDSRGEKNQGVLPTGFVLESDYERQRAQEETELKGMLAQTAAAAGGTAFPSPSSPSLPHPVVITSSTGTAVDPRSGGRGNTRGRNDDQVEAPAVDAEGILAMLKKDVRGRRGM